MKLHPVLISTLFILRFHFFFILHRLDLFRYRYPLLYTFIFQASKFVFGVSLVLYCSDFNVVYCSPNSDSWTDDYLVGSCSQQTSYAVQSPSPPTVNYDSKPSGEGVGETRDSSVVNVATGRNENNSNNNNVISNSDVNITHPYNSNPMSYSSFHSIRNIIRRRFFWYICESDSNNYSKYKDFKPNWNPNTRIRAEIKQDLLNDLEKLKLQKHTLSWFLNIRNRPTYR